MLIHKVSQNRAILIVEGSGRFVWGLEERGFGKVRLEVGQVDVSYKGGIGKCFWCGVWAW